MEQLRGHREELQEQGLPTRADGVTVHVMDMGEHGKAVSRTAAGEAGLGEGATVQLHDVNTLVNHDDIPFVQRAAEVGPGTSLDQLGHALVLRMGRGERGRAQILDQLTDAKTSDRTEIVNQSFGISLADEIVKPIGTMVQQHPNSPMMLSIAQRLGRRVDQAALADPQHPGHKVEIQNIARVIWESYESASVDSPAASFRAAARAELEAALERSRAAGLFTVTSVGNNYGAAQELGLPEGASRLDSHGMDGMLHVGATEEGDFGTELDDTMADFSSIGADLVAPGTRIPTGAAPSGFGMATDQQGTSFASPYVAGLAALMLKANPALTPDDLDAILRDPANLTDLAGTDRDGAGQIDPVAAVAAARDLRTSG
jgi:hypothetical protein